jgi:UDP-N-acetylmuramoylalanine--D-glutamate ligase
LSPKSPRSSWNGSSSFRPKVGAWLNISNDHLDRHSSFEEYAQAKARLFAAQQPTTLPC